MLRRLLAAALFPAAAHAVTPDLVVVDPSAGGTPPSNLPAFVPGADLPGADLPDGVVVPGADVELPPAGSPTLPPSAQIVNGSLVGAEEFPEVVYLSISTPEGASSCTGSLIQSTWVLTAAHCVDDAEITAVEVLFGSTASAPTLSVAATRWFYHPDWSNNEDDPNEGGGNSFVGDVALVELAQPVTDRAFMALNPQQIDNSWIGLDIRFIGFGITRWQGSGGGVKRQVDVPISGFRDFEVYTFDGTHSTCQGDSGGPGVVFTKAGYSQVSVTSYGIQCGTGLSGAMRVDHYLDWIQDFVPNISTTPSAPPTFLCSHQFDPDNPESVVAGVVGDFNLKCATVFGRPDEMKRVQWEWGDGTVSEGYDADHEYAEPGNYTIRTCFDYEVTTEVGTVEDVRHCVQRDGYVRACGVPQVAFTLADSFQPRTVDFRNQTDLSVYGCIFSSVWDIFEGDEATGEPLDSVAAWSPTYTFDKAGTYTVVLNVGGLAGTGAAKATLRVTNVAGNTCSHGSTAPGSLAALGLGVLALAMRRRR